MTPVLRRWWQRWLQGRLPAGRRQRLNHRGLFLLPTPLGLGYLGLCVVLYVFASNYQNTLILALSCLLLSVFVSSTLVGFFNLAGLVISAGPGHSRPAGQAVPFELTLASDRRRYQLQLAYDQGPKRQLAQLPPQPLTIQLAHPSRQRGWLKPGRLAISSLHPLGLCRIWSTLDLNQAALVWPRPEPAPPCTTPSPNAEPADGALHRAGIDNFQGLEPWQQGENLSRVAWKQAARGGPLQSKRFVTPLGRPQLLQLDPSAPLEQGLSRLAWQLEWLERQHQPFGLVLPDNEVPLGQGNQHLKHCLDQLARFPEAT